MSCIACPDGVCQLGLDDCPSPNLPGYAAKLRDGDRSFADIIRQISEGRPCDGCADSKPCVSIIIAARNCEAWLADAIYSAKNQEHAACEIIYSDDASTDGSVAVARSLGCKVITSTHHHGVCAARNAAARVAKGEWLLHLDGDDILPREYVAHQLRAIARDPGASFAYSDAQAFGAMNQRWPALPWDAAKLWDGNWINTSSLVRRDHFWLAGGWQEGIGTAWDWDLWTRLAQLGKHGVYDPRGYLLYRRHRQSISYQQGLDRDAEMVRMNFLFRNRLARTTICCVLSDRLIGFFPQWLDRVAACVDDLMTTLRREKPYRPFGRAITNPPNLTILYTGDRVHREFVSRSLDGRASHFGDVSLTCQQWAPEHATEQERRDKVSTFLAGAYNRFLDGPSEILWFLEDDILPPVDALTRLNRAMLGQGRVVPVVTGWYRNRHVPDELVLHEWPNPPDRATLGAYTSNPDCDAHVDLAGTGCMLIFKPLVPHRFDSHVGPYAAHDWNWCLGLRRYRDSPRPLVLADVHCRHHTTLTEWV